MDPLPISVVVTTHEARDRGPALCALLAPWARRGADVHFVDSGSTDGGPARLAEAAPWARHSRLEQNRGPCATRNLGLREARYEAVLLLDDDMHVEDGVVEDLLSGLEEPDVVAVGPAIHKREGSGERVEYAGGFLHYAGLSHILTRSGGAPRRVGLLTSGCLLVRRTAVLEVGGFDEGLFYLMEDVELSYRLRAVGGRLQLRPAVRAWNAGGSAALSHAGAHYPERRAYLHARNRLHLILANYEPWTLLLCGPGIVFLDLAWLAFAVLAGRGGASVRGRLDLIRRPSSWWRRRRQRFPRRIGDARLLADLAITPGEAASRRRTAALGAWAVNRVLAGWWQLVRRALA